MKSALTNKQCKPFRKKGYSPVQGDSFIRSSHHIPKMMSSITTKKYKIYKRGSKIISFTFKLGLSCMSKLKTGIKFVKGKRYSSIRSKTVITSKS